MSQELPQPKDGDVVLGGTSIDISTAVVLGGIEGAKRDLQSESETYRLAGLDKALKYGEEGLGLVVDALKDPAKVVKSKAYKLLRKSSESIASKALEGFYDFELFEKLRTIEGAHTFCISSIAITNDDKYIVSGSNDSTIKIWNFETGNCFKTLDGHTGEIYPLALTDDGKYIVSRSDDKTIKIRNFENGKCLRTLEGHTGWINSIAITNDDKYIVSGSNDSTIKIWDFNSGKCLKTFKYNDRAILSKDNRFMVTTYNSNINIWGMPED